MKYLQNGSDIRGVALSTDKSKPANLGPIEAYYIFKGFVFWLNKNLNRKITKVAVGRDPRLSGPAILTAIKTSARDLDIEIADAGLASTPAMFMSTKFEDIKADGSIMITASHLPSNRNGMKFFTEEGGLDKSDIGEILNIATKEASEFTEKSVTEIFSEDSACQIFDYKSRTEFGFACKASASEDCETGISSLMELYADHLKKIVIKGLDLGLKPLENMKIIVDAGNGSGGFYEHMVLKPLGALTEGSVFLNPDGNFPNHEPNPENKKAMEMFSKQVVLAKADLGLIFDTDVDRSAAVTPSGKEIARNGIVALAAALIADKHPGTTVVTDSITSKELTTFLEKNLSLKHLRFKRGYKNVINKAIELNAENIDCQLAIETSGHGAYKENFFLDDGAYLATKIVIAAAELYREGKTIESLISDLNEPKEALEFRFPIAGSNFADIGKNILLDVESWVDSISFEDGQENPDAGHGMSLVVPNYEGVRIDFDEGHGNGWALLRASLHDPILVLNVESNSEGGSDIIRTALRTFLKQFNNLDIGSL